MRSPITTVTAVAGLVLVTGFSPAVAAPPTQPTSAAPTTTSAPGGGNCLYRPEQPSIASTPWEEALLGYDDLPRTNRGSGVKIAVIDSGFTGGGNQLSGIQVGPGINVAGEAAGYTADCGFQAEDKTVPKDASIGHGTDIVSILAAQSFNTISFVGMVPNATIIPIKYLPDAGFPSSTAGTDAAADDIANGIDAAVKAGATVINISSTIPRTADDGAALDRLQVAVIAASQKAVIVASSGNLKSESDNVTEYPAGFAADNGGCNGVISVGASDNTDKVWASSNTKSNTTLVAPGVGVAALGPKGQFEMTYYGSFTAVLGVSGTSYSAAYVSGAAALILGMHPNFTPVQVCQQLERTAVPLQSGGWNSSSGAGRIDPVTAATDPLQSASSAPAAANGAVPAAKPVAQSDRSSQHYALAIGAGLIGFTLLAGLVGFLIRRLTTTTRRG